MTATGQTVQSSNSVTGKRSLHQGIYWVAGFVSWRVRLRTRIHLVPTLRMCGAIPPLPYILSWRAYGVRGWGKLQDSWTCQVWNLKSSFAIVITINKWSVVGRANRLRGLESRVVWRLNVWTREAAAGRNLNDGSFTPHSNLITWWARHVARMWKISLCPRHEGILGKQRYSSTHSSTSALGLDEW
jgi:hypothetical protein